MATGSRTTAEMARSTRLRLPLAAAAHRAPPDLVAGEAEAALPRLEVGHAPSSSRSSKSGQWVSVK